MSELSEIKETLTEVRDTLLKHVAQAEDRERRLENVEATVYGNGTPGLKMDMEGIKKTCAERHKTTTTRWGGVLPGVVQTLIGAALIAIIVTILGLWKTH